MFPPAMKYDKDTDGLLDDPVTVTNVVPVAVPSERLKSVVGA